MDNIFFDLKKLKYLGKNVIIGKCVRIRHPERVIIDDYAIIDDFTYISTKLSVGKFVHIGSNSVIQGGQGECSFADFSGCSPGCKIITCSDDYISGLACPQIPQKFKGNMVIGRVILRIIAQLKHENTNSRWTWISWKECYQCFTNLRTSTLSNFPKRWL